MYISRLFLDPANRQVIHEIANRYELHRTLTAQFEGKQREEIGLLFRLEEADTYEFAPPTLLVQTLIAPDWEKLYQKGMLLQKAETKLYEPELQQGDVLYFRLLANPTVRRRSGDFAGKRVELRKDEEHEAWLVRKSAQSGFTLQGVRTSDRGKITSTRFVDGKKQTITHQAVLYDGVLEVRDAQRFLVALKKGIGPAKAFGFGLLSLAKG
jgi:CRISPR system Cascade subunit CasE